MQALPCAAPVPPAVISAMIGVNLLSIPLCVVDALVYHERGHPRRRTRAYADHNGKIDSGCKTAKIGVNRRSIGGRKSDEISLD